MQTTTQLQSPAAPADLGGLNGVIQTLVGLPFLFSRRSYGDELKLHFGTEQTYDRPKLKGLPRGSHVLGLRASHWQMLGGLPGGSGPTSPPALVPSTPVQVATATAQASGYNLLIVLTDATGLLIVPNPDPDLEPGEQAPSWEDDVADWELFTPEGHLRTGPGLAWAWEPAASGRAAPE